MARFLGDSPLRVFLKLVVISFLVGIVMSAFGWSPFDVLYGIRDFFVDIWNMGFSRARPLLRLFPARRGDRRSGLHPAQAVQLPQRRLIRRIPARNLEQDGVARRQRRDVGRIAAADDAADRHAARRGNARSPVLSRARRPSS